MRFLRYLYILALALWLGGMSVAGLVVAPVTFGVLEGWNATTGRVLAGDVFGAVLARMYLVAYAAGILMCVVLTVQRLLGPRPRSYGIRIALIVAMLALTLYSGIALAPRIDELQAAVTGPMNALPTDDARRVEFDRLHSLSTSLAMATIVGGLVLLGWETRE
jgi:Domain of unknown function (DUF4149)